MKKTKKNKKNIPSGEWFNPFELIKQAEKRGYAKGYRAGRKSVLGKWLHITQVHKGQTGFSGNQVPNGSGGGLVTDKDD